MTSRYYFDHNATTPLCEASWKAIERAYQNFIGNPSSVHHEGRQAKKLLNETRDAIAQLLGVTHEEIFFTSGCTEAINLLIRGLEAKRYISTQIEHASVYQVVSHLSSPIFLDVGKLGAPQPSQLALLQEGDLAIFSAANSETGSLLDLPAIAHECQMRGAQLIIDGTQLLGKLPFTIPKGVTAMAFSAHKFGGPTGIGFFYLKRSTRLNSLMFGGHQERRLRPGTENLLGIAGLHGAIERLQQEQAPLSSHLQTLRDRFEARLLASWPGIEINGEGPRLPNTSNLAFIGIDAEELLILLDQAGIAASHGSACSSGALEPSRVLINMGYDKERVRSSVRFSFGATNTLDEIERGCDLILGNLTHFSCK